MLFHSLATVLKTLAFLLVLLKRCRIMVLPYFFSEQNVAVVTLSFMYNMYLTHNCPHCLLQMVDTPSSLVPDAVFIDSSMPPSWYF